MRPVLRFSFVVAVLLMATSSIAFAGFEFVAPGQTSRPAPMPVVPNAMVKSETLPTTPIMHMGQEAAPAMPAVITEVVKESDALLISDDAVPAAPNTTLSKPVAAAKSIDDNATIDGFGRQVPLVMALQQIVPSDYRYSFGRGVVAGTRINWTGGKPWKDVVVDIARRNDMNVEIVSNVIAFRRREPMDIIAAQAATPSAPDTVQGFALKPVMPPVPAPVTEEVKAVADMAVAELPPVPAAPAPVVAAPDAPMSLLAVASDKPIEDKPAVVPEKTTFDPMLDANDKAASSVKPTEEKKILVADGGEQVATSAPIVDEPVKAEPVKAEMKDTTLPPPVAALPEPVVAAPAPAPVVAAVENDGLHTTQEWAATKGATLRSTLEAWSNQANVSLVWSSEFDYPLQTDVRINASYADAVRTVLAGFSKAQPRPLGRLFRNKSVGAKPVLVVETDRLTH